MVNVKLNRRMYVSAMHGHGIHGRYHRVPLRYGGKGIVSGLGKEASKYVLGGIGKSTGSYAGKQLGQLIQDKTGSALLGKIAKAGLSALGGVAGEKLGSFGGKFLGKTVFSDNKKKKKGEPEPEPQVSLGSLLQQARSKVMGASGSGINLIK